MPNTTYIARGLPSMRANTIMPAAIRMAPLIASAFVAAQPRRQLAGDDVAGDGGQHHAA